MTIEILEARRPRDLAEWIRFPFTHYRGDGNFVPPLLRDEHEFFSREKNPAFRIADVRLLLAKQAGRTVGRVCGILHHRETEKLGYRRGRFGWFESTDDPAVARALLAELEGWFRAQGCREMTGPHGFSDLDPEGLLVEGFAALPTVAGSYNKPYYPRLLEGFGLEKEVDYLETRFRLPEETPALIRRMEERALPAAHADGLQLVGGLTKKGIRRWAGQFWEVLEEAFAPLYGVTPLSADQRAFYERKYFPFVDPRFVQLVADRDGRLQGFFLGLPSLSRAFQKAGGRLLPFGWYAITRAFRRFDTVDFYFAGVRPGANPRKVLPLMALGMWRNLRAAGVSFIETNRELETNTLIVGIWSRFEVINRRRTRIYRKQLS
ncbi:MAG: hypothetical protein WHT06_02135 [Desulfobacterales bacterium]